MMLQQYSNLDKTGTMEISTDMLINAEGGDLTGPTPKQRTTGN